MRRYVDEWILGIEDVTALARAVEEAARLGSMLPALPDERDYPLDDALQRRLGYDYVEP